MSNNINKICRNYNVIVNCEFLEDDLFSKKLIEFYKNAVSKMNKEDTNSINKILKYDKVMRKYIEDYNFSLKLKNSIDVSSMLSSSVDLTDAVLDYAVDFSTKYDDSIEEAIVNTRWI